MFPEKDVSCIWVDAGLISYKLCDRNFGCDECPFDMVMRQKSGPASVTNQIEKIEPDKVLPEERPIAKYESVTDLLNGFLAAPSSVLLPGDRMYSRSHTWLREIRTGVFRIGVDHYAAHFIEHLSGLAVQQVGTSLKAGDPLAWVTSDGGTVALLSPLSGRIVNTNSVVRDSPHAAAANPYDQGWVTEIAVI
ncbi:MAG: glycine cleavage system protein H, partial [Bacteroidetes bacterium]|nr:glycine cleavage system protein H [Bacteroidota bacterium]